MPNTYHKAASDGFMWGAIGGSFSGGATSLVNTAATSGSKAAASAAVGKGVDVATDTGVDMAQTVASGGKITLGSVLTSAGTSLVLGNTGGGKANKVAGAVQSGSKNADLDLGSNTTNNMNNLDDLSTGMCFVAGTLIFTDEGKEEIEDIQVGDYVYARDQYGEEQDYKEVTRVFIREKNILIHLKIDEETITTTEEHPFYIEGEGFVEARELEVGDLAENADGENVPIEAIEVEYLEEPVAVYNFEVEDYHTYYVGNTEVLVHNTCAADSATINNLRRNENQQALHDIAKESAKQAKKGNPISYDEARILDEWAKEYKVSQHHQAYEGSGNHFPGGNYQDHTHIYNVHVPYKN